METKDPKKGQYAAGRWLAKKNQMQSLKHPMLIILSLVCKSGVKEAHSISSNPLLKKEISKEGG